MGSHYTADDRVVTACDICGLFCNRKQADWYTPYGCANPDEPEPYDPAAVCPRCQPEYLEGWRERFARAASLGPNVVVSGDWQKSQAELQAAREAGYEWIGTAGSWVADGERRRANKLTDLPLWRQNCWVSPLERLRLEAVGAQG